MAFERAQHNGREDRDFRKRKSSEGKGYADNDSLTSSSSTNANLNFNTKDPPPFSPIKPVVPGKPKIISSPTKKDSISCSQLSFESRSSLVQSSSSSENSPTTPREIFKSCSLGNSSDNISLDADSDKETDETEFDESEDNIMNNSKIIVNPNGINCKSSPVHLIANETSNVGTEKFAEKIPVFCVQDYKRGRTLEPKNSHNRSRSVGSALKLKNNENVSNMLPDKDNNLASRSWKMSSEDIGRIKSDRFRDKQKILEAVIKKKGPFHDVDCNSKQSTEDTRKTVNLFRKLSFTTKMDKDFHNKIAKGDMVNGEKRVFPDSKISNIEADNSNSGKNIISKIIPKLNPLSRRKDSPPNGNLYNQQIGITENLINTDMNKHALNAIGKNLINELKENHFLDNRREVKDSNSIYKRSSEESIEVMSFPEKVSTSVKLKRENKNEYLLNDELQKARSKPTIFPKIVFHHKKESPVKPSQIYNIRHPKEDENTEQLTSSLYCPKSLPVVSNASSLQKYDEVEKRAEDISPTIDPKSDICSNDRAPPVRPPRRRNSGSPRKKHKAPLPPVSNIVTSNCSELSLQMKMKDASDSSAQNSSVSTGDESFESLSGLDDEKLVSSTPDSNIGAATVLPQGPPPRKPPRTFAYEIYCNNKIRRFSKSSIESSAHESCDLKDNSEITQPAVRKVSPSFPIYAVPIKKNSVQNNITKCEDTKTIKSELSSKQMGENIKPAIAPKPTNIKSLSRKRLSLVESIDPRSEEEEEVVEELQKHAHLRYSFRNSGRNPPANPPPEPPSCPKPPKPSKPFEAPVSLQYWASHELLRECGQLSRQKSMSDETLASSSVRSYTNTLSIKRNFSFFRSRIMFYV